MAGGRRKRAGEGEGRSEEKAMAEFYDYGGPLHVRRSFNSSLSR